MLNYIFLTIKLFNHLLFFLIMRPILEKHFFIYKMFYLFIFLFIKEIYKNNFLDLNISLKEFYILKIMKVIIIG